MKYIIYALLLLVSVFSGVSLAYNQDTHEIISCAAFQNSMLGSLTSPDDLGKIGLSSDTFYGRTDDNQWHQAWKIKEWLKTGARDEDCCGRFFNHFFNPIQQIGFTGLIIRGTSSLVWGLNDPNNNYSYAKARTYYLDGLTKKLKSDRTISLSSMFYSLGHVIHLIQDLAQPQHTRNEAHGPFPLSPPERALYENWTSLVKVFNNPAPDIYPGNSQVFDKPEKFWQTGPYDFPPVNGYGDGLAEFSNYNFLTQSHNCNNSEFPNPSCKELAAIDIQSLCNILSADYDVFACNFPSPQPGTGTNINPNLKGQIYFEETQITGPLLPFHKGTNNRASTHSVFDSDLVNRGMFRTYSVNRFNFTKQLQWLIPQAIGYSAGLINYFFRGSMDANLDANGNVIVKNSSSENMNGMFTLYYDDANDQRNPVPGASSSLAIQHDGGTGSLGPFTPPTSPPPKEPGKYILVFNGKLGQEQDAVAGKIVNLCVQPPTGLIAWWPGDSNASDIQGNNNGTLLNGATFAPGMVGQAFSFDGVNDVVITPLTVSYTNGATFDAWIKTTDNAGLIVSDGGGVSAEFGMGLFLEPGGVIHLFGTKGTNQSNNFHLAGPFVADGVFHLVAGTWTGNTTVGGVKLYVDGVLVGTSTAKTSISTGSTPINIGWHTIITDHAKFAGLIDEVEIFSRALSASEIQAIYNAGSAGKCK